MLNRVLETEMMDTADEARDYDAMDHDQVNRLFVADFLAFYSPTPATWILDVGTGPAQIPIELCRQCSEAQVVGIDLAEHMLELGRRNVSRAGLDQRIGLQRVDAKQLPWPEDHFGAVISNSIIHHIPEPIQVLREILRVTQAGGGIFVRDLMRPDSPATLEQLVQTYAGTANRHQQQMLADSLHAALTLAEVRELISSLGVDPATVRQTTDRHWTWSFICS